MDYSMDDPYIIAEEVAIAFLESCKNTEKGEDIKKEIAQYIVELPKWRACFISMRVDSILRNLDSVAPEDRNADKWYGWVASHM